MIYAQPEGAGWTQACEGIHVTNYCSILQSLSILFLFFLFVQDSAFQVKTPDSSLSYDSASLSLQHTLKTP